MSAIFQVHAQREEVSNKSISEIATPMAAKGWYKVNKNENINKDDFLKAYKKALNVSEHCHLISYKSENDKLGFVHEKVKQYYDHVPVEGGELILHQKKGMVQSVSGYLAEDITLNTNVSISEDNALQTALSEVNGKIYMWESPLGDELAKTFGYQSRMDYYPEGELVILPSKISGKEHALAYKFLIYSLEPEIINYVYVDAHSNLVIYTKEAVEHTNATGTAITKYSGTRQIMTDSFQGGFRLKENRGTNNVSIHTLNMNYHKSTPISAGVISEYTDSDNYWNNFNQDQEEEGTDIHWGQEIAHDYFLDRFGRNSIDGAGGDMLAFGNWGRINNAEAGAIGPGGARATRYGGGSMGNGVTMLDVVGHEITHNIIHFSARLGFLPEPGGLNESFADIFGVSMSLWAGFPQEDIWVITHSDQVTPIRNMSDPKSLGAPDTYYGEFWELARSVHHYGNIQNFWYYLLVNGGSGTNDHGHSYNITGIGVEDAEQIAYRNVTMYLTRSDGYFAARIGSSQAAADLFGENSTQYEQVEKAWDAVGVSSDFSILAISPTSSCDLLSVREDVTITLQYSGGANILPVSTRIPVSYQVDNGSEINEVIILASPITIGDQISYTFTQKSDLSQQGNHLITATVNYAGDPRIRNNRHTQLIETATGPVNDVGVLVLLSPDIAINNFRDSETISVSVKNFSCTNINSGAVIPISYTINGGAVITESLTLPNILNSGASQNFTFATPGDFSADSYFTLKIWTAYGSDFKNTNDTTIYSLGIVNVFPYKENFDTSSNHNFRGWTNDSNISNFTTGPAGRYPLLRADHTSGNGLYVVSHLHPKKNQETSIFVSPEFDLSSLSNPVITFWYLQYHLAISLEGVSMDVFDTRWIPDVWKNSVHSFKENSLEWVPQDIDLSAFPDAKRIRFRHTTGGIYLRSIFALDDFTILDNESKDVSVTKINSPVTSSCLTDEVISVEISNTSFTNTISNFDISYNIDFNGSQIDTNTETFTGIIDPNSTVVFNFANTVDLSAIGNYVVTVTALLVGDEEVSNNSLSKDIAHTNPISTFEYTQDFELFSTTNSTEFGGWFSDIDTDIEWQTAKYSNTDTGPSRDHTSQHGNYIYVDPKPRRSGETAKITSPCFDMSTLTNPKLEFWYYMTKVRDGSLTLDVYDGTWNNGVWTKSGYQGPSWIKQSVSLAGFNDILKIRFSVITGFRQNYEIAIDDVRVFEGSQIDAAIMSVVDLLDGCGIEANNPIKVKVKNLGSTQIASGDLQLTYQIDGNSVVTETVNSVIPPFGQIIYQFTQVADLPLGERKVNVTLLLSGDETLSNNSLCHEVVSYSSDQLFDKDKIFACNGETVYLKIKGVHDATDIAWMPVNLGFSDRVFVTDPGTYRATVTYQNGCSVTDEVIVSFSATPTSLNADFTYTVDKHNTYTFTPLLQEQGLDYLWNFGDGQTSDEMVVSQSYSSLGMYTVTLTVTKHGCNGLSSQTINSIISGLEKSNMIHNWSIFPNPSYTNLTINFASPVSQQISIQLVDLSGREIIKKINRNLSKEEKFETSLNISHLREGIYLLRLATDSGNQQFSHKIVINH